MRLESPFRTGRVFRRRRVELDTQQSQLIALEVARRGSVPPLGRANHRGRCELHRPPLAHGARDDLDLSALLFEAEFGEVGPAHLDAAADRHAADDGHRLATITKAGTRYVWAERWVFSKRSAAARAPSMVGPSRNTQRNLRDVTFEYLFCDAIFESLRREGVKGALLVAWCTDSEGQMTSSTWRSGTRSPRRGGLSSTATWSIVA